MSLVIGFVITIILALIYVAVVYLNKTYNPGGRMAVNPLYSVSQWDEKVAFTASQCLAPGIPGYCIIEGLQRSTIAATRRCIAAGGCIDYDGSMVKQGESVPFNAECSTPYCGWAACLISFGDADGQFVTVVPGVSGAPFTLNSTSQGSTFYVQRLTGTGNGVGEDVNGTLAQFFFIPSAGTSALQMLCYANNVHPANASPETITALSIQPATRDAGTYLDIFVLMENMPVSIAGSSSTGSNNVMLRKILVFGGPNRQLNPSSGTLIKVSKRDRQAMWTAAQGMDIEPLLIINWTSEYGTPGYYASLVKNTWTQCIYSWNPVMGNLMQNFTELRLPHGAGAAALPFYAWES